MKFLMEFLMELKLILCLLGFHDWERMLSSVSGHDLYVCMYVDVVPK